MPKAVRRLGRVFTDCIVRSVTVVARGDRPVARLLPAGVLFIHNVAICAGDRVIAHVRVAFGINEREQSNSYSGSDRESDQGKFEYL